MAIRKDTEYPGRWDSANSNYPLGQAKNRTTSTSKDGSYLEKKWIGDYEALLGAALGETGETPNGVQDTALDSQIYKAMQKGRQVEPIGGDWNGYLDPEHQSNLPSLSGYPGNSGGGEVSYSNGDEISLGIYSATDGNSVSSDSDGWVFSGSIYKEFELTSAQVSTIDVDSICIYVKGQDGSQHFVKNGDTGVTVSKSTSSITVTLSSAVLSSLGISKLWRFFVSFDLGHIQEISPEELQYKIRGFVLVETASGFAEIYRDGSVEQYGQAPGTSTTVSVTLPVEMVDANYNATATDSGTSETSSAVCKISSASTATTLEIFRYLATGTTIGPSNWRVKGKIAR